MDGDDRKDGENKALGSLTTSSRETFGFYLSMDVIMVIASNGKQETKKAGKIPGPAYRLPFNESQRL